MVSVPESGGLSAAFMAYLQESEQVASMIAVGALLDLVVPLRRNCPVRTVGMAQPPVDENFLYFG